jgi:hypothetical protein
LRLIIRTVDDAHRWIDVPRRGGQAAAGEPSALARGRDFRATARPNATCGSFRHASCFAAVRAAQLSVSMSFTCMT